MDGWGFWDICYPFLVSSLPFPPHCLFLFLIPNSFNSSIISTPFPILLIRQPSPRPPIMHRDPCYPIYHRNYSSFTFHTYIRRPRFFSFSLSPSLRLFVSRTLSQLTPFSQISIFLFSTLTSSEPRSKTAT